MGADLFGSFAESTCAALVVSSTNFSLTNGKEIEIGDLMFPLLLSAFGILASLVTSIVAIYITKVNVIEKIESTLKF